MISIEDDVLGEIADDWSSVSNIYDACADSGLERPSEIRQLAFGVIAELVSSGMLVAGDLEDTGFVPWPLDPGETLIRIASEWFPLADPVVDMGDIAWFATTPAGQARGESHWHEMRP